MDDIAIEDYMRLGPLEASDAIREITGQATVNVMGSCIGGTLLAIWSNVVNNYLLGQAPAAFDLLYWNSDCTRMARAAHSWYLRNTYLENNLIQPGKVRLDGETLDLRRIELDVYAVGAEKDHIVPWQGAWRVTQLLGARCVSFLHPAVTSPASSTRPAARARTGSTRRQPRPLPQSNGGTPPCGARATGGWIGTPGWPLARVIPARRPRWGVPRILLWTMRQGASSWKNSPLGSFRNRSVFRISRGHHPDDAPGTPPATPRSQTQCPSQKSSLHMNRKQALLFEKKKQKTFIQEILTSKQPP
jgi:hypothetical protein